MSPNSPLRTRFSSKTENVFSAGLSMIRPKRRTSPSSMASPGGPPSPPASETAYHAGIYSPVSGLYDSPSSRQPAAKFSSSRLQSSTCSVQSVNSGGNASSLVDDAGHGSYGHSLEESIYLTPPRASRPVCAICDMKIGAGVIHEDTTSFDCGHMAHTECLQSYGGQNSVEEQPHTCPICDLSQVKTSMLIPSASPMSLDTKTESFTPPSEYTGEGFIPVTKPMSSLSLFDTYTASTANTLSETNIEDSNGNEDLNSTSSSELTLSATSERDTLYWGDNSVSCLVGVSSGAGAYDRSTYRHTAADMSFARKKGRDIASLKFMGRPLGSHQIGKLRLVDRLYVSNEELTWKMSTCYLFEGTIVVTRDAAGPSSPQIKALVDIDSHLEEATVHSVEGKPVLTLFLNSAELRELHFTTNSSDTLQKWCQAIHNTSFCYPLAPCSRALSVPNGGYKNRAPLELVLCVPTSYLTDTLEFRVLAEILANILKTMAFFDKLGFVFYGRNHISSVPLRPSTWHGWENLLQTLRPSSNGFPGQNLAEVLEHTSQLLKHHQAHRATASVLVIGNKPGMQLNHIPWGFLNARTPINTIGVGRSQDAASLSTLAASTGGQYVTLSSHEEMAATVCGVVEHESQLTHKNVRLLLKALPGAKIMAIRGWSPGTSTGPGGFSHGLGGELSAPAQVGENYVIELGNMSAGDYSSISVSVEFSDIVSQTVARLGERPTIMQVCISSEEVLGGATVRDDRVVKMQVNFSAMPPPMPPPTRNTNVVEREIQCLAADTMELALGFMGQNQKDYRRIIREVDGAVITFKERCQLLVGSLPDNASSTQQLASYLVQRISMLSDQALLSDANAEPVIKELVELIWCLRSQRTWSSSTQTAETFRDTKACLD